MRIAWKIIKWTFVVLWNALSLTSMYLYAGNLFNRMRPDAGAMQFDKKNVNAISTLQYYNNIMINRAKLGWKWIDSIMS